MDYYERLRTSNDFAACDCASIEKLLLVYTMSANPIHCFTCKGQVDPERLGLTEREVALVEVWDKQFSSLYDLWIASGDLEEWAKAQLLLANGQVNVDGLRATRALSQRVPTYYWWFHDTDDELPASCPSCGGALDDSSRHGERQCEACQIII